MADYTETLSEPLTLCMRTFGNGEFPLPDELALDSTMAVAAGISAREASAWSVRQAVLIEGIVALSARMELGDVPAFVHRLDSIDALGLSDVGGLNLERLVRATEMLRQLDALHGQSELATSLLSGIGLDEGVATVFGGSLAETATLAPLLGFALLSRLRETTGLRDGVGPLAERLGAVAEQFTAGDRLGTLAALELKEVLTLLPSLEELVANYLRAVSRLGLVDGASSVLESTLAPKEGLSVHDTVALLRLFGVSESMLLAEALFTLQAEVVREGLLLVEQAAAACELTTILREILSAEEISSFVSQFLLGEQLDLTTGLLEETVLVLLARDPLVFAQAVLGLRETTEGLTEPLVLRSMADLRLVLGLGEIATLADAAVWDLLQGLLLGESLTLSPQVLALQEAARRGEERLRIATRVLPVLGSQAADGLALASALAFVHGMELRQTLQMQDAAVSASELLVAIQEIFSFADFTGQVFLLSAADSMALLAELLGGLVASLAEQLELVPSAQGVLLVALPAAEQLGLAAEAVALAELLLSASTSLLFIERLPLGEEVFSAWAFNSDTLSVTQYTNFPMNSFMELGGKLYGVAADGLYLLEGESDAGTQIDTLVCTGDLSFGHLGQKYVPRAYLLVTKPGDVLLKTHSYNHGQQREHFYKVVLRSEDEVGLVRVPLRREVRGEFWAFELQNVEGGDFELQGAEVLPVLLSRRV